MTRSLFGKLQLRYTAATIHSQLDQSKTRFPYRIVAKDCDSVAIVTTNSVLGGDRITHIHFESSSDYWIGLGRNREWFRRVNR